MHQALKVYTFLPMGERFIFNSIYQLHRKISETDDFELYDCLHIRTKQTYAIWFLKFTVPELELLVAELQKIQHPNLIKLISSGKADDQQYLITESLDGNFLRYASYYQSLNATKLIAVTRTMFDLHQLLSKQAYTDYAFTSQYIFQHTQGQYKFMPLQPQLLRQLRDNQLSLIAHRNSNYLLPKGEELTRENLEDFRFFALFFVWIEQAVNPKFVADYITKDSAGTLLLSTNLKNEFLGIRDLILQSFEENEYKTALDSFLDHSLYSKTSISDVLNDIIKPVTDSLIIDLGRTVQVPLVISEHQQLNRSLRRKMYVYTLSSNTVFFTFDALEEGKGEFTFCEKLAQFLVKEFAPENRTDIFEIAETSSVFEGDKSQQLQEHFLMWLSALEIDKSILLYISSIPDLDLKSSRFINQYAKRLKKLGFEFIFNCSDADDGLIRKKFPQLSFKPLRFRSLKSSDIQKMAQAELKLDLIQSTELARIISAKANENLSYIMLIFDWIKLAFKSSLNDVPQICKQIEAINSTAFIYEAKVEQVNRFVELLLFFAFLKKPISIDLIDDVFSSTNSLQPLLLHLVAERVLYVDEQNCFELAEPMYKSYFIQTFAPELTFQVSMHFRTIANLKSYFDYDLGVQVLLQQKRYEQAIEVVIKQGNYLKQSRDFAEAAEQYHRALDLAQQYTINLNETIKSQALRQLTDYYISIGFYSQALHALDERLNLSQHKNDLCMTIQREDLLVRMDRFTEIEFLNDTNFYTQIEAQNDVSLRAQFYLLHAAIRQHDRLYTEALEDLERVLACSDLPQYLLEQAIWNKLNVLREIDDFAEISKFSQLILNKKSKLVSQHCIYSLTKTRAVHFFQLKQFEEAKKALRDCEALAQILTMTQELGDLYTYLANIASIQDSPSSAMPYYQKALEHYSLISHEKKMAISQGALAVLYKDLGQISLAIKSEQAAFQRFQELEAHDELIYSLANMAHIYTLVFDYDTAERYVKEALQLAQSLNKVEGYCHALLYLSMIESMRGHTSEASKHLMDAINLISKNEQQNYIHYTYYRSLCDYESGHFKEAKDSLLLIIESNMLQDNKKYNFVFTYLLGSVLIAEKDIEQGEQLLERSLGMAMKQENLIYQLMINLRLFDLYTDIESEKLVFTNQNVKRLVKQIANGIHDDVLRVNFLQSRQVSRFKQVAVS